MADTVNFVKSVGWDGMVTLKECKTKECQNSLQQLQLKKQVKEEDHVKMEGQDW
jgi:hypothetical protein